VIALNIIAIGIFNKYTVTVIPKDEDKQLQGRRTKMG